MGSGEKKTARKANPSLPVTARRAMGDLATESAELLRAQNMVLERIANGAPLRETLDSLLRSIDALAPPVLSSILLLDEDGVHIRHAAAPNLPAAFMGAIDGGAIGEGVGSCGTAAYRKEPVITTDIATDPRWDGYRRFALVNGLHACWSTPIFDEQRRVLGTFALYLPAPGGPTKWHQKLIENATRTASIAIVRHRENEALKYSEERLRLAVKGARIGIWEWEPESDRFQWSDELKTMLGLPGSVPTKTFLSRLHPDDRRRTDASLRAALADESDYKDEFRVVLEDLSLRWIAALGRGHRDPNGVPVRMLGVAIDITERKQAEEEINRREGQLASAQRLAHFGSYEWEPATGRVDRSEELYRIFGLRHGEFASTLEGYLERVHPEDRASTRSAIQCSFQEKTPFALEERIVRPDSQVRVLYSQGHWELDQPGRPLKLVGTCQDITERKRADEELRSANTALQALGARLISAQEDERARIARELHDDLSQQIAAVSIAVSNLRKGLSAESPELRAHSERIQEKLVHLAGAVRQLSHELHPAILEHAGLAAALSRYCSDLRELAGFGVSLRTEGAFEGMPAKVALAIYRVAQEALQNAVKHSGAGNAEVSLVRARGVVSLVVSDEGRGISASPSGAGGLGLISMKERARMVNGTLDIHSHQTAGTTVTFTVPDSFDVPATV
jgi:PAS domain S-box-containing protein